MQYLGNQAVQAVGRTKNLINEDIFVDYGAEKLSTGEYYFVYASTPYKKHVWDNTENYQGKLVMTAYISWVNTSTAGSGVSFRFNYTDGTTSGFTKNPVVNGGYYKITFVSQDNKTVSYIDCSYGTATCQTYLKNVQLNKGETALPYQPYLQRYDMYLYNNLIKQPYWDGLSKTINGITFTVDEETGWVTANGTATSIADFNFVKQFTLTIPAHSIIKGCPNGGSSSTYQIQIYRQTDTEGTPHKNFSSWGETDNEVNTWGEFVAQFVRIRIRSGVTVNNLVFKPELLKLIGE